MQLPRSEEFFGYGSVEVTDRRSSARPACPCRSTSSGRRAETNGFAAIRVGIRSPEPADLMDRAVAAAAAADVAIVMVGTNDEWETEGFDRTTMDLPGRQDELVRRVVRGQPAHRGDRQRRLTGHDGLGRRGDDPAAAPAILTSFFAGQEQAEALVDVLFGDADPGGRLPITIPVRLADHPAYLHHRPDHDSVGQGDAALRRGAVHRVPRLRRSRRRRQIRLRPRAELRRRPIGARQPSTVDGRTVHVELDVTGTGDRTATDVVQGYVAPVAPSCTRAVEGTQGVGQGRPSSPARVGGCDSTFDETAFRRWDTATDGWLVEPGEYDLVLATSSAAIDERQRHRITIT